MDYHNVLLTIIIFLTIVIIFLLILKIQAYINESLIKQINNITSADYIGDSHKLLTFDDFNEIMQKLKEHNYYPNFFIEVDCNNYRNLAYAILFGFKGSYAINLSEDNFNKNRPAFAKFPEILQKKISLYKDGMTQCPENSLIFINDIEHFEDIKNKLFSFKKNFIFVVKEMPNCKMNSIKTTNFIILTK